MQKKPLRYKLTLISRSVRGRHESVFAMLPMDTEVHKGPLDTTGRPSVKQWQVQSLLTPTHHLSVNLT